MKSIFVIAFLALPLSGCASGTFDRVIEAASEGAAMGAGVPPSQLASSRQRIQSGELTADELDRPWREERAVRAAERTADALEDLSR